MVSTLHLLGPDLSTGTAKQIRCLTEGLAGFGDTSQICSLEHEQSRKSRLERFLPSVEYCRQSLKLDPTIVVRCARLIRVAAPDVVHCWGRHHATYVRLALRLAGVRNEIWSVRSMAEGRGLRRLNPQLSCVTNAAHLADSMSQNRQTMVSNGVAVTRPPSVITLLHRELELCPESTFIAAVGDLRDKKRLTDVVWAVDLLRVIHPHVHLLILGEGEVDRDLRSFIASAASASAVHLLGFREDVPEVLRQCSCFWQASDDEGCSNAILEAMALGLPVIASDTAGHRDILRHGAYGSLVRLGDCAEMARKTNIMLSDMNATREQGQKARKYVLERFAMDQMIAKYRAIYQSLPTQRSRVA